MVMRASGVPRCAHPCLSDLFVVTSELITLKDPVEKFNELCMTYRNASLCVDEQGNCMSGTMLDTLFSGIEKLCDEEDEDLQPHSECLGNVSEKVAEKCDGQCSFSDSIVDLSERESVHHIAITRKHHDRLLQELGNVCSSTGCMTACMAKEMNEECGEPAGSIVVEAVMKPFFKAAAILDELGPRAKAATRRQLPEDCHFLIDTDQLKEILDGVAPESSGEGSGEGSGENSGEGSGEGSGEEGSGEGSGEEGQSHWHHRRHGFGFRSRQHFIVIAAAGRSRDVPLVP